MGQVRVTVTALVAAVTVAGCSGRDGTAGPSAAPATVAALPSRSSEPPTSVPIVNSSAQPHGIPAALVGRWGIGAADCERGRSDAKGLMVVTPDGLEFYESRGQIAAVTAAAPDRLRAAFAFTGEGMSWTYEEELRLQPGGRTLVRHEYGKDAIPGPITYTRCS